MCPGHHCYHQQRYWPAAFLLGATHHLQMHGRRWWFLCFPVCFPGAVGHHSSVVACWFVKLMKWLNMQNEEPMASNSLLWVCSLNSGGSFTGSVFFPGFLYLGQPLGLCFIHCSCGAWQRDTSFKMRFQYPYTGLCITVICLTSNSEKVSRMHMLKKFSYIASLCSYLILV